MQYLTKDETRAMDKLLASYGGPRKISKQLEEKRDYAFRKKVAQEKGFGKLLEEVEQLAKNLPKVTKYKVIKKAVATTQVSAWQGAWVTHNCLKRVAENGTLFLPREMISVVALTDDYVYGGELITTLAMCENILGAKFCSTSLVGTPLPPARFERITEATGIKIPFIDAGDGMKALQMNNQGTLFGNICGIEVANDNHLVYLDSITRTALETGANFFLNPSWSTIVAACYYCRNIPNISFKVSCFLGVQNLVQFRMLLDIIKHYRRPNGTSPVAEINLGNAISPDKFVEAHKMLKAARIKGIRLTAHIKIPPDLGRADYNWFENALRVLESGCDMTLKYESDGACTPDDTIMSYFMPAPDRQAKTDLLGEILYRKVLCCDSDARKLMEMGYKVKFAEISE